MDAGGGPYWIILCEQTDLPAIVDATLNQRLAITGQRLIARAISDLTGQAKSTGRVAVRAGVALNEGTMEYCILGIVDPVLVGKLLTPNTQMNATNRNCNAPLKLDHQN
jgi:hypothetical protein